MNKDSLKAKARNLTQKYNLHLSNQFHKFL